MKGATPYVLSALLFAAGIFIGRTLFSSSLKGKVIPASTSQASTATVPSPHLNPLINCPEYKELDMTELQLFKPEISRYIEKEQAANPAVKIAYYFRDLNNGLWIGYNEKEQFSPASLMKVPVMIAVLKEAENNPHLLDLKIQFNAKDFQGLDEESGITKEDGKWYSVEELITNMIDYSDNASTILLIKYLGLAKVEKVSNELNLPMNSKVNSETNFVMVKSYGGVFRVLYNGSYLNRQMSEKALQFLSTSKYQDGIRAAIPPGIRVAHKYGERDVFDVTGKRMTQQLHHFGIVYYPHKPFLVGIMVRGGERESMNRIIRELTGITYSSVDRQLHHMAHADPGAASPQ